MPAQNTKVLMDAVSNVGTTPLVSATGNIETSRYVSLQLVTTLTAAGSWKIEVSNNANTSATALWSDVTSGFSPTIAAVLSGGSNQYTQCDPLDASAIRATFTPTSGTGACSVLLCSKGVD